MYKYFNYLGPSLWFCSESKFGMDNKTLHVIILNLTRANQYDHFNNLSYLGRYANYSMSISSTFWCVMGLNTFVHRCLYACG